MRKQLLTIIIATVIALTNSANAGFDFFQYAVEDATVDSSETTTNYGNDQQLSIQGSTEDFFALGSVKQTYLSFDLSEIPDNAEITSAVFAINLIETNDGGFQTIDPYASLHYVEDDNWTQATITFDTAPANNTDHIDEQTLMEDAGYYYWDLFSNAGDYNWSDYVIDLDDNRITLMIRTLDQDLNNNAYFHSSESTIENTQPYLSITYIPEPATIIILSMGTLMIKRRKKNTIA